MTTALLRMRKNEKEWKALEKDKLKHTPPGHFPLPSQHCLTPQGVKVFMKGDKDE